MRPEVSACGRLLTDNYPLKVRTLPIAASTKFNCLRRLPLSAGSAARFFIGMIRAPGH